MSVHSWRFCVPLVALAFFLLILLSCPSAWGKANFRAIEKRILDSIIGQGRYDCRIRPMGINNTDGPALVRVNIFVRSISRIDDVTMEYTVQMTFREQWRDERLQYDDLGGQVRYLTLTEPDKLWKPDLFFSNEKEGHFHNIIMPNVLLRIHPNGDVLFSIRISLVLSCPMNLKFYPLDKQICSIVMVSYGYTTEDLVFLWKEGDPVQVTKNLHLPRFTLERFQTDYCTSRTNTGEYSCLRVDLVFKREFSYYLIQIYIPCCMLVIVSWVSFWLDPTSIPARVSLGVTTLLTMATQISGINASLPPVSYTKAIDVWTGVCLTFVFGALLEFALVNYASRSDSHRQNMQKQKQRKWELEPPLDSDHLEDGATTFAMVSSGEPAGLMARTWPPPPLPPNMAAGSAQAGARPLVHHHGELHADKLRQCEVHMKTPKTNLCKAWLSKFPTRSKRIDVVSRIFFPLMFALFNLVYWTTYLFREDKEDE
ncbi:glutamate-gated chloride channel isoform X5 [Rhipicephalus sanguineus]|uniref:glutamate-gated chloride channel isoform X5 n=1 Tax=Rhipicephalus sanguineus TaxID=34632 RepID=UPI00189301F9|nr:glutamate-gated chloride channel isoform X5 [Rhipicephalus sanguineus]XP_049271585.1 glutamate-gated chloride channel isoform X5 [Rhipicephalus sanguineus]